uniref:Uncharacterized protein n=1 Tax=Knipowitschia caucasica TaxID=637954 RepID=A0AAV2KW35_KNICA
MQLGGAHFHKDPYVADVTVIRRLALPVACPPPSRLQIRTITVERSQRRRLISPICYPGAANRHPGPSWDRT